MTWLNEIEENLKSKYIEAAKCGGDELAIDQAVTDGEVMARVIRELAIYTHGLEGCVDNETMMKERDFANLSLDAKELLK